MSTTAALGVTILVNCRAPVDRLRRRAAGLGPAFGARGGGAGVIRVGVQYQGDAGGPKRFARRAERSFTEMLRPTASMFVGDGNQVAATVGVAGVF